MVGGEDHLFVLADYSIKGSPAVWAGEVAKAYREWGANYVVAEVNFGGDMVAYTIETIDPTIPVRVVHASRGKAIRAEPLVAKYQKGKVHHAGSFRELEDEQCTWVSGQGPSPNRIDALVWAGWSLVIDKVKEVEAGENPMEDYRG
jgi:phage terminase large subunit-like protein